MELSADELRQISKGLGEIFEVHFDSTGDPYKLSDLEYEVLRSAWKIVNTLYYCEKFPKYNRKLETGGSLKLDRPTT